MAEECAVADDQLPRGDVDLGTILVILAGGCAASFAAGRKLGRADTLAAAAIPTPAATQTEQQRQRCLGPSFWRNDDWGAWMLGQLYFAPAYGFDSCTFDEIPGEPDPCPAVDYLVHVGCDEGFVFNAKALPYLPLEAQEAAAVEEYMHRMRFGLPPGLTLVDAPVTSIFSGSCDNAGFLFEQAGVATDAARRAEMRELAASMGVEYCSSGDEAPASDNHEVPPDPRMPWLHQGYQPSDFDSSSEGSTCSDSEDELLRLAAMGY